MTESGLRERKKTETRKRISDTATSLFVSRGFERVSVDEIAEAADVSKMTVFNYFPRKEDLMLDRHPELIELLTHAVRTRAESESPLAALHRLLVGLAHNRHPLSAVRDGVAPFLRTVRDSPALLARARQQQEELETVLADLLAEAAGAEQTCWHHRLVAGWVVVAQRTAYSGSVHRLLAGEHAASIVDDHVATLDAAFAALDVASQHLPQRGSATGAPDRRPTR